MSFICITMKFESAVDEVVTYCTEVCFGGYFRKFVYRKQFKKCVKTTQKKAVSCIYRKIIGKIE